MTRTVKVVLDVEEDPFVRGVKRSDDALSGLDKTIGKAETTAKSTSSTLGKTNDQLGKTGRAAKAAGQDLDEMRRHAAELDRQIKNTERGLVSLAKGFANTGDTGILKAIAQQKAQLSQLQNVRTMLPDPQEQGSRFGRDLMSSVAQSLSSQGGTIGAALLGAGLAPTLGAAVAGAMVGGAGAAGVVGGLALAARDPRVKSAGTALGKELLADLEDRADVFVEPALAGIRTVRGGFRELGPDLDRIFASSAGFVDPLVQGALKGTKALTHGLADATQSAGPVMDALGGALEKIGEAAGDAFSTVAPDARTGALAINDMTNGLTRFVQVSAEAVHYLALIRGGSDGSGGLEGIDRQFDRARYWVEDSSQVSDVLRKVGVNLDLTADKFKKGSAEGEAYRRMTLGTASAQDLQLLSARGVQEATDALGGSQNAVGQATGALSLRQQVLNSDLHDGIAAAGGFAEALKLISGVAISSEEAEINYQRAIDAVTQSIEKNGHSLDRGTEKGRANREALLGVATAIQTKAQATYDAVYATKDQAAAEAAGARVMEQGRRQLIRNYLQFDNNIGRAKVYANSILGIPKSWSSKINLLGVEGSIANLRRLKAEAAAFAGRNYSATARLTYVRVGKPFSGIDSGIGGNSFRGNRHGGIHTPVAMAAGGIGQIYPASNPPLYQFAEPETGGEAFIPRRGDRVRGRMLVSEVASWYGMAAVPMARGAVIAAATGLVNVAPRPSPDAPEPVRRGSRLDTVEAYISARNAVNSLNAALKENGRSMSLSTAKGRENRAALNSAIRAAQESAKAKYNETGSVRAANAEYDKHIRALRQVLAQQKVNATTRNNLIKQLANRPVYDIPVKPTPAPAAPKNSSSTVAFVQAQIAAEEAVGKASGFFDKSWGKPTFAVRTPTGRDNLSALLDFLGAAGGAAQARYTQTGSAREATKLYDDYLRQLRGMLAAAGMSRREIDGLLKQYARITLGNRYGGVYEHAQSGVLRGAHIATGGPTRYAYAEPATGGELFAPRRGDLAKTRAEVGWAVRNWWGGDVRWQSGRSSSGSGQGGVFTGTLVLEDGTFMGRVRGQMEAVADAALGALADAHVYQTAS